MEKNIEDEGHLDYLDETLGQRQNYRMVSLGLK